MESIKYFKSNKIIQGSETITGGAGTWSECDYATQEGPWQTGIRPDTRYDKYSDAGNFLATRVVYKDGMPEY